MNDLISYVEHYLFTFEEKPFTEVDSLVLAQLSYQSFPTVEPLRPFHKPTLLKDLLKAELFSSMFLKVPEEKSNRDLFLACCASPRFRNIGLLFFADDSDEKAEKQFSAITFLLNKKTCYVAFRGTDLTMLGWKENFNMAFRAPVPSQIQASAYLDAVASLFRGSLLVGGHSKGGNLAVFASVMCKKATRNRILAVYSHDGPGFVSGILNGDNLAEMLPRIHKTVPRDSVVGQLLEVDKSCTVVQSHANGLFQHSAFTWDIEEGKLVTLPSLSASAELTDKTLNNWIEALSSEEKEQLAEVIYKLLNDANLTPLSFGDGNIVEKLLLTRSVFKTLPPQSKEIVKKTMGMLAAISLQTFQLRHKKEDK